MSDKPLIYGLYDNPVSPEEIEKRSFAAIDAERGEHSFNSDEWIVVRRMIHTTADFSLMNDIRFSKDSIEAGVRALKAKRPIYTDANMIRSGISQERLKQVCPDYTKDDIYCFVADDDVRELSIKEGLPRSIFGVRKAAQKLGGGIFVFGNAPTALMELNRLIAEKEISPDLVIAMPVGFVHVTESKEELMKLGVPYIAISGRRGGSPLAVSVIHSLSIIAKGE